MLVGAFVTQIDDGAFVPTRADDPQYIPVAHRVQPQRALPKGIAGIRLVGEDLADQLWRLASARTTPSRLRSREDDTADANAGGKTKLLGKYHEPRSRARVRSTTSRSSGSSTPKSSSSWTIWASVAPSAINPSTGVASSATFRASVRLSRSASDTRPPLERTPLSGAEEPLPGGRCQAWATMISIWSEKQSGSQRLGLERS